MSEPIHRRVGDSRTITHAFTDQEMNTLAQLTNNINPLHVDAEAANRSAAGGQVVDGMLAAAFLSTPIGVHILGRGAIWNTWGLNGVS